MPVTLFCWRCNMDIPMLTEPEWAQVEPALKRAITDIQDYRKAHRVEPSEARQRGHGASALKLYNEITGFGETNVNAIWHHRASDYGPPCGTCGKPLRTPRASFCAACGARA
jgi:hypothetical protein